MRTREAIFAWAERMAANDPDICVPHHFIIQSDGFVYAMPEMGDALAWWPLPYIGPDGEADFAAGRLLPDGGAS